jgi:hypothetical protein
MISAFNAFLAAIDTEIKKMEDILKKREAEVESKRSEREAQYANTYIPGWEPDGYKPTKD